MGLPTVPVFVSKHGARVDVRGAGFPAADPDDPVATRWRSAVARELKVERLWVQDGSKVLLRTGGQETVAKHAWPRTGWRLGGHFHTPSGLGQLMERENRATMDLLVGQLRSPMGVVPFVGAGLSAEFGLPMWNAFLGEAACFCSQRDQVESKIAKGKLIDAATDLFDDSRERFQRLVARRFGKEVGEEQVRVASWSGLGKRAMAIVATLGIARRPPVDYFGVSRMRPLGVSQYALVVSTLMPDASV